MPHNGCIVEPSEKALNGIFLLAQSVLAKHPFLYGQTLITGFLHKFIFKTHLRNFIKLVTLIRINQNGLISLFNKFHSLALEN